tara:strand:+ start:156 stop:344 length:189 start_codon:yes stop_codon:yes gene_type:complete
VLVLPASKDSSLFGLKDLVIIDSVSALLMGYCLVWYSEKHAVGAESHQTIAQLDAYQTGVVS